MQRVLFQRSLAPFAFTNCALLAVFSLSESVFGWISPVTYKNNAGLRLVSLSTLATVRLGSSVNPAGTASTTVASTRTNPMTSSMSNHQQCSSSTMEIAQIPCLRDNYGYLVHDTVTGQTAAIDTPEAAPYESELKKRGWKLTHILNTHHHWDHTGANAELKTAGVQVIGPANEKEKIPGIDVAVKGGDTFQFGSWEAQVLDVGGHTVGHIAFYFPSQSKIFVGDSLFALGCGRMFEGTPEQFWASLKRLRDLPDETMVYCAHEYTLSNGKFAMSVEPGNPALVERFAAVKAAREKGDPTVPSQLGVEKQTNPFLRVDLSTEIQNNVGVVAGDSDAAAFGKIRRAKDNFQG